MALICLASKNRNQKAFFLERQKKRSQANGIDMSIVKNRTQRERR